jgi:hypothetical protein
MSKTTGISVLTALILALSPSAADPPTVTEVEPSRARVPLHVDDDGAQWPGAYTTIMAALDDANVGDIVLVHDGVYSEVYLFTDRISLRAVGNVLLDSEVVPPLAGPPGSVWVAGIMVLPGVSGVTIQGFEIRR